MELKDTMLLMNSEDYKDRFKAEYYQTRIRFKKLNEMVVKCEANSLEFKTITPICILRNQLRAMGEYLHHLEVRAVIEEIDLKEII